MTINPKVARRMREVRARLRDVAAAEHSVAAASRADAECAVEAERGRLERSLSDATGALATARHVYDLDAVAAGIASHHDAIAERERGRADASAAAELTAARLRERTRQLRTAERVVELLDRTRAAGDARTEQRGHDDLAGRRR